MSLNNVQQTRPIALPTCLAYRSAERICMDAFWTVDQVVALGMVVEDDG
jgi:hypothetical protein